MKPHFKKTKKKKPIFENANSPLLPNAASTAIHSNKNNSNTSHHSRNLSNISNSADTYLDPSSQTYEFRSHALATSATSRLHPTQQKGYLPPQIDSNDNISNTNFSHGYNISNPNYNHITPNVEPMYLTFNKTANFIPRSVYTNDGFDLETVETDFDDSDCCNCLSNRFCRLFCCCCNCCGYGSCLFHYCFKWFCTRNNCQCLPVFNPIGM